MEKIFEVATIEQINDNQFNLGGRAYEDISVGNILHLDSSNNVNAQFMVMAITTYGYYEIALYAGMTGNLILQVKEESKDLLSKATHLFIDR